jgi:hypothetical protein
MYVSISSPLHLHRQNYHHHHHDCVAQSALEPDWCSDIGVTHVICMTDPSDTERPKAMLRAKASFDGAPQSSIYWLEEENKHEHERALVQHMSAHRQSSKSPSKKGISAIPPNPQARHLICQVDNDDDDKTHDSWNNLLKVLSRIMEHFVPILRVS